MRTRDAWFASLTNRNSPVTRAAVTQTPCENRTLGFLDRSRARARVFRGAFATLVVAVASILVFRAFASIDVQATFRLASSVGPFAPLGLLPFLAGMALDAAAMRMLLGLLERNVSLARLLPIRVATEALHVTAPAGFLVADSATATLLAARCGVPFSDGAILAVARKWLVMRAHGAYMTLGAVATVFVVSRASVRMPGGLWVACAVAVAALGPLALSIAVGGAFRGRPLLARLHAALSQVRWCALRARIGGFREKAAACDGRLASIGQAKAMTWLATAGFLGCWLFESFDTAVILRFVGAPFDLVFALAAESAISMLRSLGNVVPAGLGVQDAGYATLLPAMGLPFESAAAFVILKRGKELVWVAVGYSLLAALRRAMRFRPPYARRFGLARQPVTSKVAGSHPYLREGQPLRTPMRAERRARAPHADGSVRLV